MMQLVPAMAGAVTRALEQCGAKVLCEGRGGWSFDLGNGKPFPVTARWDDPWLRLRAPLLRDARSASPWPLLVGNGRLRGAARVAREAHSGSFALHADLPFFQPELVDRRLSAACDSFRHASEVVAGTLDETADPLPGIGDEAEADSRWVRLGEEQGWQLAPRADQCLAVDLDAPGVLSRACVERRGMERSLWIEVLAPGTLSEQSRRAVALFVLTATARLRMVRGRSTDANNPAVHLEVRMPAEPTGDELNLALSALSLACRWCSRELRGLSDNRLAGIYLDQVMAEESSLLNHTIGED